MQQTLTTKTTVVTSKHKGKYALLPILLVTSLFFFWGFIHNLDPILIPHLRKAFQLTDLEAALIDFAVYIAYFGMALPAGYFIKKFGFKAGIILGLILFALGSFLFIPAADTMAYLFFLFALFIIACGLTLLETAANPYITMLGDPATATQRLNFAQSFNGLAAFLAPVIGGKFILSDNPGLQTTLYNATDKAHQMLLAQEAQSVKGPYTILGIIIILIAVIFLLIKMPKATQQHSDDESGSLKKALKHIQLRGAIVAQFFYVGAQVCVLSFFIRIVTVSAGISETDASWYAGFAGLAFMAGRFVGTTFMQFIAPNKLLIIYAVICMGLTLSAIFAHGIITAYLLIAISFFMSIMFPTIFSLGIRGLGADTQIGSSLIVMSIVGGAVLPLGLGFISDITKHIQYGLIVPLICFAYVSYFGFRGWKPAP